MMSNSLTALTAVIILHHAAATAISCGNVTGSSEITFNYGKSTLDHPGAKIDWCTIGAHPKCETCASLGEDASITIQIGEDVGFFLMVSAGECVKSLDELELYPSQRKPVVAWPKEYNIQFPPIPHYHCDRSTSDKQNYCYFTACSDVKPSPHYLKPSCNATCPPPPPFTLSSIQDSNINIDTTATISHTSSESWACAGLDWWPTSKCDYGTCAWGNSSLLNLDLDNKRLQNAVSTLSPVFLRLGGSLCDSVRYDFPGVDCVPFSSPTNDTRLGYEIGTGCLSTSRWDKLNQFCTDTGCYLLFGINALIGRSKSTCPPHTNCNDPINKGIPCCTNWSGEWDSSNAKQLLEYTYNSGHDVYGFEFGNELIGQHGIEAHLNATQYAKDFCVLKKLIDDIWIDPKQYKRKPKVISPDDAFDAQWYSDFLSNTTKLGCTPDVITWHQYILGAGVDPNVGQRALDPKVLNKQKQQGDLIQTTIETTSKSLGIDEPEIWMGEAGGAYNSGRPGVTDAFHSR